MSTFINQIVEDIKFIQEKYTRNNPLLVKDEYAFNYWVLSKLFNVEEEIADDNITEYQDDGIDCYVFYEDSKELYIIQNKYYSDDTILSRRYVQNDFLSRPITALINNTYIRSEELQQIFNTYKDDTDFCVHLYLYVTNDRVDQKIIDLCDRYQNLDTTINCYVDAKIFYLSDIQHHYFEDRKSDTKSFRCNFYTINDGTVLNIDRENYNLPNLIQAKYLLTPVSLIYEIYKAADDNKYPLFAANIREYLGNKGINARMAKTLENPDDRDNFFYYNNGITVICDKIKKGQSDRSHYNRKFEVHNPQVVNGCQTVSTIYEVLKKKPNELDQFKDTFVMVKILELSASNEQHEKLYTDIVKYNNSQNAITEKAFNANQEIFFSLQSEFKSHGFLLAVKQSDKNKFSKEKFNDYRPLLNQYENLFDIQFEKTADITISLEKLLQVILAFDKNGHMAFTKKSYVLKHDSPINSDVIKFIKSSGFTTNDLLKLYLLFIKAEKARSDDLTPIPYYLIGFLGNKFKFLSSQKSKAAFDFIFSSKDVLNNLYGYYSNATAIYKEMFANTKNIEYNKMVKMPIDDLLLIQSLSMAKNLSSPEIKSTVSKFDALFQ